MEGSSKIYYDFEGRAYIQDGCAIRYIDPPKPKKKGIFGRISDWWNGLDFNKQLWITCGLWAADGLLWGSLITSSVKDKQAEKLMDIAYDEGVKDGQMKTYQDLAMKVNQKKF